MSPSDVDDPWRQAPALRGAHASLEPMGAEHAEGLGVAVADGALWELTFTTAPRPEAVPAYIEAAIAMQARGAALPFVVRDASGAIVGTTRYYQLDRDVPRLAIGSTWYAARAQRTAVNTQAKLLLLGHAFERLGCAAVAFETSTLNVRSRAAIERLGAHCDGVLRHHMRHRDGSLRDTVVYSILAAEWPAVRAALTRRLALRADPRPPGR